MILANDLRKAVLQAAIQGRIVDQRSEEGTGEELFAQIQARKAELIQQGVVKKEKPLPKISEDETPFDIPSTWKWVRLGDISQSIADGDHQPPPQTPSGVPFIVISNLSSGAIEFSDVRHVPKTYYEGLQPSRKPSPGDILFTVTGSYGIPVMVETEAEFCFQRHMALIKHLLVDGRYLLYALSTPVVHEQCRSVATGTAQKTVGITSLKKIMLPLPPLEEQKRISERLGRILPEIEGYASAEKELTDLQRAFPDDMRKSILQYAMQGKLVEQRPEEGTGQELYQQIQAERIALVEAGKLKKEKPLPEIEGDNAPFDIPDNWIWVKLGNLTSKIGAGSTPSGGARAGVYTSGGVPFIREMNVYDEGIRKEGMVFIPQELSDRRVNSKFYPGDLLLNITGGSIGRCAVVPPDMPIGDVNQHVEIIRLINTSIKDYIHVLMRSPYVQLIINSRSVGDKAGFSANKCKNIEVPLPPLAEQKRILERLGQILPHIEDLKEAQ